MRLIVTYLLIAFLSLSSFLPAQTALADTAIGRYRVYTYPFFGNNPYQKSASNAFEDARFDYDVAADFNYTSLLFDAQALKLLKTHKSSAAKSGDSLEKVTPILNKFTGGTSAQALDIANEALNTLGNEKDPLAKAIKLAITDFIAEIKPFATSDLKYDDLQTVFIHSWLSNAVSGDFLW